MSARWRRGGWLLGRDGTRPGETYGSWQNLNEGPTGEPRGSALLHGRAYVHPGGSDQVTLRAEWNLGLDAGVRLQLDVDSDEGELLLSAGAGLAALYLAVEARALRELLRSLGMARPSRAIGSTALLGYKREVGGSYHDRSLWWRCWADPDEWRSGTPRWREGSLDLDRLLRGEATVTRAALEQGEVFVPMLEGSYRAWAILEEVRVERPRWPAEVSYSVVLDLDREQEPTGGHGIPVPGKGENSWDCEDDAVLSSTATVRSFAEAVGELVGSVLARRARHGGKDWRPPPRQPRQEAA